MSSANLFDLIRPTQVTVHCLGMDLVLQAQTAADWIGAVGVDVDDLTGIIPGLVADVDVPDLVSVFCANTDGRRRVMNAARTALGRASGRDWWWSLNLTRECLHSWTFVNGILLRQNVDSGKLSYPDWLDAAYMLMWERCDSEGQTKLDTVLQKVPAGVALSAKAVRASLEAFAAD